MLKKKRSLKIKNVKEEMIIEAMYSDKKNREDNIMFVLISDIGKIVVDVPAEKRNIIYAINKMKEFFSL